MKRNSINYLYSFVLSIIIPLSALAQEDRKVAVFDPAGRVNVDLLEIVREEISSVVVNTTGYTVLERQLINKVLEENKFQESGLVNEEQVSDIGKRMGADYVFVTTISMLERNYYISCKMIEVATARIEKQSTGTTTRGMSDIPQTTQNIVKRLFGEDVQQPVVYSQRQQTDRPVQTTTYPDTNVTNGRSVYSSEKALSQRKFKVIMDVGYKFPEGGTGEKGIAEINSSFGYFKKSFFVGAGLGLHIFNARDIAMKDASNYPQYVGTVGTNGIIIPSDSVTYMHAVNSSFTTLPVFLDVRGYLPLQNSKLSPFFMLRLGYAFNISDSFGGMGYYMNPALGIKFRVSSMIGINFSLGYSYQSYGGVPKDGGYGYYYYKDRAGKDSNIKYVMKGAGGFNLKFGLEF